VILVDTSVWVDHLRAGEPVLAELLAGNRVLVHPFVVGELACGNLRNRDEILSLLRHLPAAAAATDDEALAFIDQHALMGRGIGYVDVHLLAAAMLAAVPLWTRDKHLAKVASALNAGYP